jgi:hypothetical protein
MKNTKAIELFNEQFKFKLTESVRHKGDSKNHMSADMGLLITSRRLEEQADDDGNVNFTRIYICRMIRFGGSGDMAAFKESELMTIDEYNKLSVEEEQRREEMRNQMYATTKEIFDSFGVKRGSSVYLKNGDIIDKSLIFKVTGYSQNSKETLLHLRIEAGEGRTINEVKVKSKSEFVLVSVADEAKPSTNA